MEILNSTVIITGGSSGIGFEMCTQLIKKGNKIIACGRSLEKLAAAQKQLPDLIIYHCDIAQETECKSFAHWIIENHPEANVLINNAAIVTKNNFIEDVLALENLNKEICTNFIAPLRLTKLLYPVLIQNSHSKIINITTGLVYVPRAVYTFYNSAKAALHSFTQVLRYQLRGENIQVIEVLFPVVDTPWHDGNPPKIAITPEKAVSEMLKGISSNKTEIRVSKVKLLYFIYRLAPKFAFKKINSVS
ncbi:SDR family oxidoreductase [Flavobacterium hibisci]|uniref:SDR family oxidoreductase n=1 Tax=Flavobacterium hibisci TaxID=1914462 RepID=UPI001CBE2B8B|nr:SDR family NAD(P)-dependent oxidoreductase [Flavobacterium hibisci]MBZ4041262.1 SDR family NAD(P)-dependent oxidoreductase [Flavobacterium hibisci]